MFQGLRPEQGIPHPEDLKLQKSKLPLQEKVIGFQGALRMYPSCKLTHPPKEYEE